MIGGLLQLCIITEMKKNHCLLPQTLLDALQLLSELGLQHRSAVLSAMTGHPTSGPLPPRRNRAPGEVVGGVEEVRDSISWCSTMTDVCCVFVACFVEREESLENSSPSPSWGNQPPSN